MEEINLNENEVLDDLQLNNLKIIQNKKDYRFSLDSVLLSNFIKCGHKDSVVEFCSGSGVISILTNEKCHPKKIVGFEIQKNLCDMSNRSLVLNNIQNINFLNLPLADAPKTLGSGQTDVVICNPPYYEDKNQTDINPKYKLTKYEVLTNLEEIFKTAKEILKFSGKFFMVHIPTRLQEILTTATKHNFEIKEIKFIYPSSRKDQSHLILLYFVKGGKKGCIVPKPLIL